MKRAKLKLSTYCSVTVKQKQPTSYRPLSLGDWREGERDAVMALVPGELMVGGTDG